ncbi:MAG: CinA family protein [Pseudomonadota bacterium]
MPDTEMQDAARRLIALAKRHAEMIATAESCTGGLIAATLTAIDGSSAVVDGGFVTYSNAAKMAMLGVDPALLAEFGAVSEPVARAMAEGALRHAPEATITVAVTGIAGPGGGSPEKPVGLVHLACAAGKHPTLHRRKLFNGDRHQVRRATVLEAFALIEDMMASNDQEFGSP